MHAFWLVVDILNLTYVFFPSFPEVSFT